jgi:ribosomal protein L33
MANFQQALDWLNEGKKVRIKYWNDADTKFIEKKLLITALIDDLGNEFKIPMCYLYNDDWELYEEKPKHFCINPESHPGAIFQCEEINGIFYVFTWSQIGTPAKFPVIYCPFCGKSNVH